MRLTPVAASSLTENDLPLIPTMKLTGFDTAAQTAATAARSGRPGGEKHIVPSFFEGLKAEDGLIQGLVQIRRDGGLPFFTRINSSPSHAGMTLLISVPVFCRSVTTRNSPFLSRFNSSFDKQTASTRLSPLQRCNCIRVLMRALLTGVIVVSSTLDIIFSYSDWLNARTFSSLILTLTPFQPVAGFVEIIPEAMQEEVLDLLLPAAAGLWGFDRPVALPRRQVSKCQIFDEQDTLTITEVEQESSNLLVTIFAH